jgi:hypothetical protein
MMNGMIEALQLSEEEEVSVVVASSPHIRVAANRRVGETPQDSLEVAVHICGAFDAERFDSMSAIVKDLHLRQYSVEGGEDGYIYCEKVMGLEELPEEMEHLEELLNSSVRLS